MGDKRMHYFRFLDMGAVDFQREQDYHRAKHRRLWLEQRGHGIVRGMLPVATSPATLDIEVPAGYAIDSEGNEVIVEALQVVGLDAFVPGVGTQTVYIVAEFQETGADPVFVDELNEVRNTSWEQGALVQAQLAPPSANQLELARIEIGSGASLVTDAADPDDPQLNEIDLRHATRMPRPPGETILTLWQDETGVAASSEKELAASLGWLATSRYRPGATVELHVVGYVGSNGDVGTVEVFNPDTGAVLWTAEVASDTLELVRAVQENPIPINDQGIMVRFSTTTGASNTTIHAVRLVIQP